MLRKLNRNYTGNSRLIYVLESKQFKNWFTLHTEKIA